MNVLKNTLIVLTLISLGSYIDAKARVRATGTRAARTPSATPLVQTLIAPISSKRFLDIYAQVKSLKQGQVVTQYRNTLGRDFIEDMIQKVRNAELGDFELTILLRVARDKFIEFTGDDEKDLEILQNVNRQIKNATTRLGELVNA